MKVYPDANIYITYLLGQKGEDEVVQFFKQGISCRFSIVAPIPCLRKSRGDAGRIQ